MAAPKLGHGPVLGRRGPCSMKQVPCFALAGRCGPWCWAPQRLPLVVLGAAAQAGF